MQHADGSREVAGPLFVSIGDKEKLSIFLGKNPRVPRHQVFVEDISLGAYKGVGFGRVDKQDPELLKASLGNLRPPELEGGIAGWWKYVTTVAEVAPIPKEGLNLLDLPEATLQLGGTFVVQGGNLLYQWSDRVPGDHPDIGEVWKIAQDSAATIA